MGEGITITSFNGHAINDGTTYKAKFLREVEPNTTFEAESIAAEVAGNFAEYVRSQPGGKVMPLYVEVVTRNSGTALADIRTLKAWMSPEQDEVYLKGTDTDSVAWRMAVKCEQLVPFAQLDGVFIARLYATEPVWEQDAEQSDTQTDKAATPVEWTITPTGSMRCYPTIEITPDVVKAHANGYCRRMFVVMANKVPRTVMDSLGLDFPVDVVDHLLDSATIIAASRMQADGDDVRVFVDGKRIKNFIGEDRFLQDINSATAKVWTSIAFRPCRTATLDGAMTDASPANTESIHVDNMGGLAAWPSSGYLLADDEVIYYGERDGAYFYDIRRAQMGTAAAAHDDAKTLYWVEHEIQILYDYTAAANPPASSDVQPVIDLANSTNAKHIYVGPFIDPDSLRTGQFLPMYRETNEIAPYLSMDDTGAVIKVVDTAPVAGKPQRNNLELYTPLGVDTAANSLEQDVTVPNNMLARVYGTDTDGNEALLAEWNPETDGADEQITPAGVLTRLRYEGLVRMLTAAEPAITGDRVLGNGNNETCQDFELDQDSVVVGISLWLKKTAGADGNVRVIVSEGGTAGDPDSADPSLYYLTIAAADIGTEYAEHYVALTTAMTMPVGTDYHLILYRDASASEIYWGYGVRTYPRGSAWNETADTWSPQHGRSMWFRIFGDGSVCQDEVPTGTAAIVQLDNIEITWDAPPYVKFQTAESVYAYSGVLENETTGQSVSIYAIGKVAEALTIDCAKREVYGGELGLPIPYCAEWSDEAVGIYLNPGANSMSWTETGLGTLTFVTTWRARWS